jgi:hypothetical protein
MPKQRVRICTELVWIAAQAVAASTVLDKPQKLGMPPPPQVSPAGQIASQSSVPLQPSLMGPQAAGCDVQLVGWQVADVKFCVTLAPLTFTVLVFGVNKKAAKDGVSV